LMVAFLLLAKGWSINRDNFSPNEWRGMIMSASAFYMCNSIVLVLETSVLSQRGFWIANTILYGLMYLYIVINIKEQLLYVYKNVKALPVDAPAEIGGPLRMKLRMYAMLLLLILVNISFE
ncbi:unnamed protein product, partial [Symbiodinium microadriaticum]